MKIFNKLSTGFTLIEVMLATVITALVIVTMSVLWRFMSQNFEFSLTQFRLTENASRTVTDLITEIRQTEEAMNGAYPLALLEDDEIIIYADLDRNGSVERVRYFVENKTLIKGVIQAAGNPPQYDENTEKLSTIVSNLAENYSPLFRYYNQDWPADMENNPLPASLRPLDTRMISVQIPIALENEGRTSTYTAESLVQIRNLKRNL